MPATVIGGRILAIPGALRRTKVFTDSPMRRRDSRSTKLAAIHFERFQVGRYRQLRTLPEQLPTPLVPLQAEVTRMAAQRAVFARVSAAPKWKPSPGVRAARPVAGIPR